MLNMGPDRLGLRLGCSNPLVQEERAYEATIEPETHVA